MLNNIFKKTMKKKQKFLSTNLKTFFLKKQWRRVTIRRILEYKFGFDNVREYRNFRKYSRMLVLSRRKREVFKELEYRHYNRGIKMLVSLEYTTSLIICRTGLPLNSKQTQKYLFNSKYYDEISKTIVNSIRANSFVFLTKEEAKRLKNTKRITDYYFITHKRNFRKFLWRGFINYTVSNANFQLRKPSRKEKEYTAHYFKSKIRKILFNKPQEVFFFNRSGFNKRLNALNLKRMSDIFGGLKIFAYPKNTIFSNIFKRKRNLYLANWSKIGLISKKSYKKTLLKLNQSWGNIGKNYLIKRIRKNKFKKKVKIKIRKRKLKLFFLKNIKNGSISCKIAKNKETLEFVPVYARWLKSGYSFPFFGYKKTRLLTTNQFIFSKTKLFGHPFHLVNPSILPIALSFVFFTFIQNILSSFTLEFWYTKFFCILGHTTLMTLLFSVIITWILEIYSEEQGGCHTLEVQKGFQYAVLLFILSELMLFVSFFWAYFHFSLNSNSFTGGSYTPNGLVPFYWFRIPLLNTLLLLASGLSLTIAHMLVVESDKLKKIIIWFEYLGNCKLNDYLNIWNIFFFFNNFTDKDGTFITSNSKKRTSFFLKIKKRKKLLFYKAILPAFYFSWFLTVKTIRMPEKGYAGNSSYLIRSARSSNDSTVFLPLSFAIKFKKDRRDTIWQPNYWLLDTVVKGFIFLIYQAYEYTSCMFSINDSAYGAVFFSLTGLHGIHVFLGVMFLFFTLLVSLKKTNNRLSSIFFKSTFRYTELMKGGNRFFIKNSYNDKMWTHRIAFDAAAWYWHFVDVVWFFVFVFVYWWGFSIA